MNICWWEACQPPVAEYAKNRSFTNAEAEKAKILTLYRNDIARFAGGTNTRLHPYSTKIPSQLSKHEKKFRLSALQSDARMRTYEEAFFWLSDARIANICYNTTDPHVGLSLYEDRPTLNVIWPTRGFWATHAFGGESKEAENLYRDVLLGKLQINEGMLVENAVAQSHKAQGRKLWFYSRHSSNPDDRMEIDFLRAPETPTPSIVPIETKSTKRYTTTSLDKFKKKYGSRIGGRIRGTSWAIAPRRRPHLSSAYMVHAL